MEVPRLGTHRLSETELATELRDHVAFMLASARDYDQGTLAEAKRLAVELRVFLHDALLDDMGVLSQMPFYDTALEYSPDNALPHYGLLTIRHRQVLPAFDSKTEPRRFVPWDEWSSAVVLSNGLGGTLTRYALFKTAADKQGAHVDLKLPQLYSSLCDSESAAYRREEDDIVFSFRRPSDNLPADADVLLPEPVAPSIRQLAHEVLVSLASYMPEAFTAVDLGETLSTRPGVFGIRGASMPRELLKDGPLSMHVSRHVQSVDGETLG